MKNIFFLAKISFCIHEISEYARMTVFNLRIYGITVLIDKKINKKLFSMNIKHVWEKKITP